MFSSFGEGYGGVVIVCYKSCDVVSYIVSTSVQTCLIFVGGDKCGLPLLFGGSATAVKRLVYNFCKYPVLDVTELRLRIPFYYGIS